MEHEFTEKISGSKKRRAHGYNERAGDRLALTAAGNQGSAQYLEGIALDMPEKVRAQQFHSERQKERVKMKGVKPFLAAGRDHLPDKYGEIDLDTGVVEVGRSQEEHKQKGSGDVMVSFVRDRNSGEDKAVSECGAREKRLSGNVKLKSNDEQFDTGAASIRCKPQERDVRLLRQICDSASADQAASVKRVLPFADMSEERARIAALRDLQKHVVRDRLNIHTAITGVEHVVEQKEQRTRAFRRQMLQSIRQMRKAEQKYSADILRLRRKREEEQQDSAPAAPQSEQPLHEKDPSGKG